MLHCRDKCCCMMILLLFCVPLNSVFFWPRLGFHRHSDCRTLCELCFHFMSIGAQLIKNQSTALPCWSNHLLILWLWKLLLVFPIQLCCRPICMQLLEDADFAYLLASNDMRIWQWGFSGNASFMQSKAVKGQDMGGWMSTAIWFISLQSYAELYCGHMAS